jgi:DNA (cytosine-5)-methyltransferase 1
VAENVPGIVKLAADAVCKDLERFGYSVGIWQYEAAAVGAPHKRLRVFFIGCLEQASETEKIFEDVPHPGCRMLQRGAVEGAFRGESGERPASDAERSGSSLAPAADRERREGQRSVESGLDRVVDGFSSWLDGSLWWGSEPDIPRTARSVPNRRNRLKALGNAVVPAQFYPIFKAIMKIEKEERMLRKRETARTI